MWRGRLGLHWSTYCPAGKEQKQSNQSKTHKYDLGSWNLPFSSSHNHIFPSLKPVFHATSSCSHSFSPSPIQWIWALIQQVWASTVSGVRDYQRAKRKWSLASHVNHTLPVFLLWQLLYLGICQPPVRQWVLWCQYHPKILLCNCRIHFYFILFI